MDYIDPMIGVRLPRTIVADPVYGTRLSRFDDRYLYCVTLFRALQRHSLNRWTVSDSIESLFEVAPYTGPCVFTFASIDRSDYERYLASSDFAAVGYASGYDIISVGAINNGYFNPVFGSKAIYCTAVIVVERADTTVLPDIKFTNHSACSQVLGDQNLMDLIVSFTNTLPSQVCKQWNVISMKNRININRAAEIGRIVHRQFFHPTPHVIIVKQRLNLPAPTLQTFHWLLNPNSRRMNAIDRSHIVPVSTFQSFGRSTRKNPIKTYDTIPVIEVITNKH